MSDDCLGESQIQSESLSESQIQSLRIQSLGEIQSLSDQIRARV